MKTNPDESINMPTIACGPSGDIYSSHELYSEQGLTKREWLAGLAMKGILSNSHQQQVDMPVSDVAKVAVDSADALIKELSKERR